MRGTEYWGAKRGYPEIQNTAEPKGWKAEYGVRSTAVLCITVLQSFVLLLCLYGLQYIQ